VTIDSALGLIIRCHRALQAPCGECLPPAAPVKLFDGVVMLNLRVRSRVSRRMPAPAQPLDLYSKPHQSISADHAPLA